MLFDEMTRRDFSDLLTRVRRIAAETGAEDRARDLAALAYLAERLMLLVQRLGPKDAKPNKA